MNNKHIDTEKEWLLHIAAGDRQAFTLFFQHYSDRVLNIAFYFTQSLPRAQDIVQDVFLKIWKNRAQLTDIEHPDSWVAAIARNYSINALKKIAQERSREQRYQDYLPAVPSRSGHFLEYKDLKSYIEEALASLSGQQRRVFELGKLQGMSRDEIAAIMNLSPNTVKMHLVRSTKYVRAFLLDKLDHLLVLFFLYFF